MALTGRQIRQLRSLAHHLEPVITVGKQGVAPAVVDQANAALEAHELIKCSALENSGLSAREAADQLPSSPAPRSCRSSAAVSLSIARPPARA